MDTLVDDIGSFPLPAYAKRELFDRAYVLAREAITSGRDVKKDDFLYNNFYRVIIDSFRLKCAAGLDVVNYPQHYDINKQFTEVIQKAMSKGTYVVDERDAVIPEVHVIKEEAKTIYEEIGRRIPLRVCVTGPIELYLKMVGTTPYKDVLLMFAETVKRFAENSILNSKYVKTGVISLDEPSLGFQNLTIDRDTLLDVLEKAFDFKDAIRQIHLHSPSIVAEILNMQNIDVVSLEYAASPKNIESLSKKALETADKHVRVGIARTDIDSIFAELYDKGVTKPSTEHLVEDEDTIRRRFEAAKEKYGERMTFTGPDCGLGGWPTQEAAQQLLKRTVGAVKSSKKAYA
jgi:5-methyltetrahydropteroyltriglutamate--homocysteine methyltransferase